MKGYLLIFKRIFHLLRLWLPGRFKRVLKAWSLLKALAGRYDPLNDPDYRWPLHGPLTGYVFKVRQPEEVQYVLSAVYEPRVCVAIEREVQPGNICADVGANIGYMTLLIARCCGPGGHVYAFEALPSNAKHLEENVAINGLAGWVTVENLAVSDGSESRVMLYEGDSSPEFSLLPRSGHTGGVQVPAVALDAYFGKGRLDFVKMDIEGAEGQAIKGMRHLLRSQRPICLIEIHGEPGLSALGELTSADYTLFDLDGQPLSDPRPDSISHILARPVQGDLP